MPKIVDPEERREAVVEALFRVVDREGLERASLRNVAAEAGLAIGSVRHYFDHHSELTLFAMRAMSERVSARLTRRVERGFDGDDRREAVVQLLAEVLPLDERRRREVVVWLAFLTASRTRPELRAHADELYDGLLTLVTHVLEGAHRRDALAAGVDIPAEARRLCAVLDGLSMQLVLHPGRIDPESALTVLRGHLAALGRD
ncbi:TetR family transcriptional regulator C-terminal domain-containing protein [Streptomyces sp. NPDC005438]|uniref:TetR/AcrR family transcriptional regulator n=1 Tax=Streptomyces sp. NPDC005438 TaxID=3156880 RepID=UPI0033B0AE9B